MKFKNANISLNFLQYCITSMSGTSNKRLPLWTGKKINPPKTLTMENEPQRHNTSLEQPKPYVAA